MKVGEGVEQLRDAPQDVSDAEDAMRQLVLPVTSGFAGSGLLCRNPNDVAPTPE